MREHEEKYRKITGRETRENFITIKQLLYYLEIWSGFQKS